MARDSLIASLLLDPSSIWVPTESHMTQPTETITTHFQRMLAENHELAERCKRLVGFTQTPLFRTLDPAEQERMLRQHVHMCAYLGVLEERISAAS
jgi:hypothetical protein